MKTIIYKNTLKKSKHDRVMSLAENFRFDKNASIAFDWSNANGLSQTPIQAERDNKSVLRRNVISFFINSE